MSELIAVDLAAAEWLLAVIAAYAERQLARNGTAIPEALVAIQRDLADAIAICRDRASSKRAGLAIVTRVGIGKIEVLESEVPQLESNLVDTATAARELEIREDSVRYLCRSGALESTKVGARHWITKRSIERHRVTGRRRHRGDGQ